MIEGTDDLNNSNTNQYSSAMENGKSGIPANSETPAVPGHAGGGNRGTNGNPNKAKQTLSDITRGVQHAVNNAQEILDQHYTRMLGRYFDKYNSPKMVRIKVPPDSFMEVPLIALMSPSSLYLDELVMDLSLRIDETDVKKWRKLDGRVIDRTSFAISVGGAQSEEGKPKDRNQIDMRMVFKSIDPPEGIARILDEFTKKIVPQKIVPKPKTEKDKWQIS